jgi:NAD(P)H-dependent flavin oxidoreductase YrpB (nitropropane dioxygenase family)
MKKTKFTELVGCRLPIQVAPMGGITTPELGGAVVGAGGHAMFGLTGTPAPAVADTIAAYEGACGRNYGVNFLVPFLDMEVVKIAASTAPLVEIYHGDPDEKIIRAIHEQGALASWQVTSSEEAVRAADLGCDLIVAHGIEAGGRMPGGIGLLPLLEQVLGRVSIPVLAAGGIATARGFAAVLAAGADGLRMGTRFLASKESGGHPTYVQAVVAAAAEDTTVHQSFQRTLAR